MEVVSSQNEASREAALRAALADARVQLSGLVEALRAIDGELDALSTERDQYSLLATACAALEELRALGAERLFWGGEHRGEEELRGARGRIDAFQKRVEEVESRHEAALEALLRAQEGVELLEDDVFELEAAVEQRKLEWIIEREIGELPDRILRMPWLRGGADDRRLRKALSSSLAIALLLALLLPLIELPLPEIGDPIEVPERVTRLIQERPRTPPPPQPPLAAQAQKLEPVEKPLTDPKVQSKPAPKEAPALAPGAKGILAFRERFSGLADDKPAAQLGLQARIDRSGEAATGAPERSMVTTLAPGSSGGINLSTLSRGLGSGQEMAGVQVARATSSIEAAGGGGGDRPRSGDGPGLGRTDEEIQIVFDRHKAALYRLYNRELRNDPTLKGQIVLRIRIEPDGSVALCELQGSDMNAPNLIAQVLERVRTFDFGAKEVPAITILYPIDFLPAT